MSNWKLNIAIISLVVVLANCDTGSQSTTPTPTTPLPVGQECASRNNSCENCVKLAKCLWCPTNATKCIPYPTGEIIPRKDVCDLGDARWGVCWVNYEVLLIVMGVLAGVLLISFGCCIYCCCCKGMKKRRMARYQQEESRLEREREERRGKHDERRGERQSRVDEIRLKYGLNRDNNAQGNAPSNAGSGYKRFENEA